MSPRTGRPPKKDPMNVRIQIRTTAEDLQKLDECAKLQNATRSDIVRQGINLVYEKQKK